MIRLGVSALALALSLAAAPVFAASNIKVTSDNFTVEDAKREAVFTGNVVIIHPSVTLKSDKVVVTYGEGGTSDVKTLDATGHVSLKTKEQTATGDRAVFDPKTQILHLTGNVEVVNASGTLNGPELTVNLATQTSTFTGSKGGRVTGVFSSQ
jgi:lipopolysaccharide export system protein LptA